MERCLAIDFGRRRIGLAVNDALGLTATGLDTLKVRNFADGVEQVVQVIQRESPARLVIGKPLNLDGSQSDMGEIVDQFAGLIAEKTKLPIHFVDERLTSLAAHRTLQEMGIKQKGNKGKVDRLAAVYLMETFMAQQNALASGG